MHWKEKKKKERQTFFSNFTTILLLEQQGQLLLSLSLVPAPSTPIRSASSCDRIFHIDFFLSLS